MIDWDRIRQYRHVVEPSPPEWPAGVKAISLNGVSLLGVHESTGELYWDGQQIVTARRLASFERWMAALVTAASVILAIIETGRAAGLLAH
ncbi:hypothetical protein NKI36_27225 [Mesorhizobium caraganae]|uniref:Uncharacterized protein n=1 Tax=Mesorhizobium caraganae TaxID=483206 RepID=A0ABV1Z7P7_9HYPH